MFAFYKLNNGFTSFQSGDGVTLFNASHPLVNCGTNANRPSTGADLNETSLENAVIEIAAFTDERGLLIAARPRRLIVPPALMFTADRLLETTQRVGTADNDINAIKSGGYLPKGYHVMRRLTDADGFFVQTDVPDGLKMFQRSPMKKGMEGDFETGNVRYKVRERYSFGFTDWRGVFGSEGAA